MKSKLIIFLFYGSVFPSIDLLYLNNASYFYLESWIFSSFIYLFSNCNDIIFYWCSSILFFKLWFKS